MNEKYLHFLWQKKRLPFDSLRLVTGQPIELIKWGIYNTASGPDFFNGQIQIDSVKHCGNIEMHVKSSDWYLHGHHTDPAYSNVILHVVYENDQQVFIHGMPVPTIALGPHIDWNHFLLFEKGIKKAHTIACTAFLAEIPQHIWRNQVAVSLVERLKRKSTQLNGFQPTTEKQIELLFVHWIAQSFGMKTNVLPFRETLNRLPLNYFLSCSMFQKEALFFGCAGLLDEAIDDPYSLHLKAEWTRLKNTHALLSSNPYTWQFKGCRPHGFPTLRIAQLVAFIHHFPEISLFLNLSSAAMFELFMNLEGVSPTTYWDNHYHFGKRKQQPSSAKMSKASKELILINGVVPFLFWLAHYKQINSYKQTAMELLERIPSENNQLISQWAGLGIHAKSAAESQGLIEQINEWCTKKRCLNCQIGERVLAQKA